jgi:hypothetical protein
MPPRELQTVLDEIDALSRRLKKIEEKIDEAIDNMGSGGGDDDDDGMPKWLQMLLAHPAAQNVLSVVSDKDRIQRMLERFDRPKG